MMGSGRGDGTRVWRGGEGDGGRVRGEKVNQGVGRKSVKSIR